MESKIYNSIIQLLPDFLQSFYVSPSSDDAEDFYGSICFDFQTPKP